MNSTPNENGQAPASSSDVTECPDSFLEPEPLESDQETTEATYMNHTPAGSDTPTSFASPESPRTMLYPDMHFGDQQANTSHYPPLKIEHTLGGSGPFSYLSTRPLTRLPDAPLGPASVPQTAPLPNAPLLALSSVLQTTPLSDAPLHVPSLVPQTPVLDTPPRAPSTPLQRTRSIRDASHPPKPSISRPCRRDSARKPVKRYTCDKCGEVVSKSIAKHIKYCLGPPDLETKLSNPWWCAKCGKRFKKYLKRMTDDYCRCNEDDDDDKKDRGPDIDRQGGFGSSLQQPHFAHKGT